MRVVTHTCQLAQATRHTNSAKHLKYSGVLSCTQHNQRLLQPPSLSLACISLYCKPMCVYRDQPARFTGVERKTQRRKGHEVLVANGGNKPWSTPTTEVTTHRVSSGHYVNFSSTRTHVRGEADGLNGRVSGEAEEGEVVGDLALTTIGRTGFRHLPQLLNASAGRTHGAHTRLLHT